MQILKYNNWKSQYFNKSNGQNLEILPDASDKSSRVTSAARMFGHQSVLLLLPLVILMTWGSRWREQVEAAKVILLIFLLVLQPMFCSPSSLSWGAAFLTMWPARWMESQVESIPSSRPSFLPPSLYPSILPSPPGQEDSMALKGFFLSLFLLCVLHFWCCTVLYMPPAQAAGTDPSWCNSTNRQNPPLQ